MNLEESSLSAPLGERRPLFILFRAPFLRLRAGVRGGNYVRGFAAAFDILRVVVPEEYDSLTPLILAALNKLSYYRGNLLLRNLGGGDRRLFLKNKKLGARKRLQKILNKKLGTIVRNRLQKFVKRHPEYKDYCKLR